MFSFLFYTLWIAAFFDSINSSKKNERVLYCFFCFLLIFLDAFKNYYLLSDQAGYEYNLLFLDFDEGRNNIGFQYLLTLVHYIYDDYVFLSLIVASIIIGLFASCFEKYSPHKWLSLFIFFITNYIMAMLAIRQYIAMAICAWSVKYILGKKQIPYLICIFLAFTFHSTAVIFLPVYYLSNWEYSKKNLYYLFGSLIVVIIGFQAIAFAFVSRFAGDYAFYLMDYESTAEGFGSWNRALTKLFILLVFLYTLKGKAFNGTFNKFVFANMVMSFAICAGGVGLFGIFRLKEFYIFGDAIGIPVILSNLKNQNALKKILVVAAVIVYIALLLYSFRGVYETNFANGYKFIWEK